MKHSRKNENFRLNSVAACVLAAFGTGQALAVQQVYDGPGDIHHIGRPVGKLQNGTTAVFLDASMHMVPAEDMNTPGSTGVAYGTRRILNDYFFDIIPTIQNPSPVSIVVKGGRAYSVSQDLLFGSNRTSKTTATKIGFNPAAIRELNTTILPGITNAKAIGPVVAADRTTSLSGDAREVSTWYVTGSNLLYTTYFPITESVKVNSWIPSASLGMQISDFAVLPETVLFADNTGRVYFLTSKYKSNRSTQYINGFSYLAELLDVSEQPYSGLIFSDIKATIHSLGQGTKRYLFRSGDDWYSIDLGTTSTVKVFSESSLIGVESGQIYSGRMAPHLMLDEIEGIGTWETRYITVPGYTNRSEFSKLLSVSRSVCSPSKEVYYALGLGSDNRLTALTIEINSYGGTNGTAKQGVVTNVYRGATVDPATVSVTNRISSAIDAGVQNFVDRSDGANLNCSVPASPALKNAGFYVTSNGVSLRLSHNADTNTWEETPAPNSDGNVFFPKITEKAARFGSEQGVSSTNFAFAGSAMCSLVTPDFTGFCSTSAPMSLSLSKNSQQIREIIPGGQQGKLLQGTGQYPLIDRASGSVDYLTSVTYMADFGEKKNSFHNINVDWGKGDLNLQRPAADTNMLISPNSGTAWSIDGSGRIVLTGPITSRLLDSAGKRGSMPFQNSYGGVFAFGSSIGFELPIAPESETPIDATKWTFVDKIDVTWNASGGPYRLMVKESAGSTWNVIGTGFSGAQSFTWTEAEPWKMYEFAIGYEGTSTYYPQPGDVPPENAWVRASNCPLDQGIYMYRCLGTLNSPPKVSVSENFDLWFHRSRAVKNRGFGFFGGRSQIYPLVGQVSISASKVDRSVPRLTSRTTWRVTYSGSA